MKSEYQELIPMTELIDAVPQRIPKRTLTLLHCLVRSPRGLRLPDLTNLLQGEVRHSDHVGWLSTARRETTKKQLQRAKHFLNKHRSSICIAYCPERRLWKLIPRV